MRIGGRRGFHAAALGLALLQTLPALAVDLRPGAASEDPVWTDRPVRIDRSRQTYERIAVAPIVIPIRIAVSSRPTVLDGASFEDDGRLYVLTDIVPIDPQRLCRGAGGAIVVCGRRAKIILYGLVSGSVLFCKEDLRSGRVSFVTCRAKGKDLAEALVAAGLGWAATPRLQAVQDEAMRRNAGIWRDAVCLALRRCPPGVKR